MSYQKLRLLLAHLRALSSVLEHSPVLTEASMAGWSPRHPTTQNKQVKSQCRNVQSEILLSLTYLSEKPTLAQIHNKDLRITKTTVM